MYVCACDRILLGKFSVGLHMVKENGQVLGAFHDGPSPYLISLYFVFEWKAQDICFPSNQLRKEPWDTSTQAPCFRVVSKQNVFLKGFPQGSWLTPNSLRFLIFCTEEWHATLTHKSQYKRGCKLNWILPCARHPSNCQVQDRIQSTSND